MASKNNSKNFVSTAVISALALLNTEQLNQTASSLGVTPAETKLHTIKRIVKASQGENPQVGLKVDVRVIQTKDAFNPSVYRPVAAHLKLRSYKPDEILVSDLTPASAES